MEGDAPNPLHALLLSGTKYRVSKRQIVQTSVDRKVVNVVVSGYIKRYLISNDGSIGIQIVYGPGDVYPLTLVFKTLFDQDIYSGPEIYYYEAMEDAELRSIDSGTLLEKVNENPILYANLLQEAGRHLESSIQQLENLAMRTSYKRVAHELLFLAKKFGIKKGLGSELVIPLTHQDLANILSVTRETVSTCMVELRDKGLINTNNSIAIPNLERLQAEAFS